MNGKPHESPDCACDSCFWWTFQLVLEENVEIIRKLAEYDRAHPEIYGPICNCPWCREFRGEAVIRE